VDWPSFDLVIIRTTWDYQDHLPEFLEVLERIDAATALENELALCRWNLEKTYLRDLEERGVPIVPTTFGGEGPPTSELFAELGRDEIVIKPVVSANADGTHRLTREAFARAEEELAAAFASRAWMAQPFLSEVVETGEYSLFSFAGDYNHAVLKTPKAGDFRVQEEHGGSIRAVEPEAGLRAAADQALAALPSVPLYARPDFVRDGDTWRLMELELVEPSLYFSYSDSAPESFAAAIEARLAR
jgi:glutathione synthase/RimK-type ligase-like ATP-grasp enzyme